VCEDIIIENNFALAYLISINRLKIKVKENTMKFVVIGADAAGMSAASRAKRTQPEMDITVLEKTMDVSYSA